MTSEPSPLKDAIMDAVYVPLERDDMQTPCALPFMTSSEHGVCDGDGRPVSDESIASALNAVAKIQSEYYRVKKEPRKETQKEMTAEPSPRPWRVSDGFLDRYSTGHHDIVDAKGEFVAVRVSSADAALICDAVNLKARIDDEKSYFHTVYPSEIREPTVCIMPPISEVESVRMYRDLSEERLKELIAFRDRYRMATGECLRLHDIIRDLADALDRHAGDAAEKRLILDARAAIGGEKQ